MVPALRGDFYDHLCNKKMTITFHGAAGTVTGSCHRLAFKNTFNVLLDCGMFQGLGEDTAEMNRNLGFDAALINAVILSHAHIDHSGRIPKLVKDGFSGKIYCTAATMELALVLLQDAAHIQSAGAQDVEGESLFDRDDVKSTLERFVTVPYNQVVEIAPGITVTFTDAGHLVGSATVHIAYNEDGREQLLSYSGDVGRYNHPLLCPPVSFKQANHLILECTYGNSLHDPLYQPLEELQKMIVDTCIRKKGKLVIAAFSVGRMQELLFYFNQLSLERRLPEIPIIVDSPLAAEATLTVKRHKACLSDRLQKVLEVDDDPFDFEGLHWTQTVEDSKKLQSLKDPCVIIASSGMADAGRVRHHIADVISFSEHTIALTGYCTPSSLGGRLQSGAKLIDIKGREVEVKAQVQTLRHMSAHADYEQLLRFISCQEPERVANIFLVHAEDQVRKEFAKKLEQKGYQNIKCPLMQQAYQLALQ